MKFRLTEDLAKVFENPDNFKPIETYSKEQLEQAYKLGYEHGFSDGQSKGFDSAISMSRNGEYRIERTY